jgi:hypothetical protein
MKVFYQNCGFIYEITKFQIKSKISTQGCLSFVEKKQTKMIVKIKMVIILIREICLLFSVHQCDRSRYC